MSPKKEEQSGEEKPKKRGRPKGVKDSKPRKKKTLPAGRQASPKTKKEEAGLDVPKKELEAPERPESPKVEKASPLRMRIEPDTPRLETMPEDLERREKEGTPGPLWSHDATGDRDLSVPPDILLKGRRPKPGPSRPKDEVEDILEEPEERMAAGPERREEFARPAVKNGLFRKLAIAFAVPVLLLLLVVAYVTYAHATVTVYPARDVITNAPGRIVQVSEEPDGTEEVHGEVHAITVGGEKTGFPSGSTVSEGIATGFATLVNETGQSFTLVATTRLLSEDGVLFRLESQATIPANGEVTAEVYADRPGASGDIGPTTFTIPGLRPETQEVVYALSKEPMTGGVVAVGAPSQEDIDTLLEELKMDLVNEAREELGRRVEGTWSGQVFDVSEMSRFVNVAPGQETDRIVVRLSLKVASVSFDRAAALDAVVEDLKRNLTSDRELVAVNGDDADIDVSSYDADAGEATLQIALTGESSVTLESPLFDAEKLRGLDLDAVQTYFEGIEGVDRVDVRFRPFWIKRMPDLADHIEFQVEK